VCNSYVTEPVQHRITASNLAGSSSAYIALAVIKGAGTPGAFTRTNQFEETNWLARLASILTIAFCEHIIAFCVLDLIARLQLSLLCSDIVRGDYHTGYRGQCSRQMAWTPTNRSALLAVYFWNNHKSEHCLCGMPQYFSCHENGCYVRNDGPGGRDDGAESGQAIVIIGVFPGVTAYDVVALASCSWTTADCMRCGIHGFHRAQLCRRALDLALKVQLMSSTTCLHDR